MPKFVILGSCRFEPYEVLAVPNKLDSELYEADHERAYEKACEVFYPAIDESDIVIVYAPEGVGEHTRADMEYALKKGKPVYFLRKLYCEKYPCILVKNGLVTENRHFDCVAFLMGGCVWDQDHKEKKV